MGYKYCRVVSRKFFRQDRLKVCTDITDVVSLKAKLLRIAVGVNVIFIKIFV